MNGFREELPSRGLGLAILSMIGLVTACLGSGCIGQLEGLRAPLPVGEPGGRAEAMADAMLLSVDAVAWEETGAVRWTFAGHREHTWDRARGFHQIRSGNSLTLIDLETRQGRSWKKDRELAGTRLDRALERAWNHWVNDAFWLNPVVKIRDPGTERGVALDPDGRESLLVTYTQGGNTPGDAYLWIPGESGRPQAWRMWVSVLPVPGLQT